MEENKTNIQLRAADHHDLAALSALARATFVAAYGPDMQPDKLEQHLAKVLSDAQIAEMMTQDVFWVAAHQHLCGFVQFGMGDAPTQLWIRRLYVDPSVQNQKLGSRLLQVAMAHPDFQQASEIYLHVWETNLSAQRFYQRFGFRKVGERPELNLDGTLAGADHVYFRPRQNS